MASTAPATPVAAPMDTASITPSTAAAATNTNATAETQSAASTSTTNAPAAQSTTTTTNVAPISADALSSALNNATTPNNSSSTNTNASANPTSGDLSDVPNFVSKLLQNNELPSDEKLLQMGEKMLEQTQMAMQVQQEMQELRQRLARFESEQDTKSRQQVEQQVQLLEQALATDPNNPAFAQNGITKESLEQFKQMTLKLAPEERDLLLKVNQSVAAFGMNSQITETFETQPVQQQQQSHQDELTRLRQQEQEARERAAMLERQQRQQQLAMRFANIQASTAFRPAPTSFSTSSSSTCAPTSIGSCGANAMTQMFQSARPMSFSAPPMPTPIAAGGVANFGSSPSVSQRMSEDTFAAAATNTTKRAADTSNDAVENPSKKLSSGSPLIGSLSNEMAVLAQKARLFNEKMALQKKSKKSY